MAKYERMDVISKGSYGVVHRARDNETGEIVAVKVLFNDLIPSFSKEIDILKSLPPHPSVVEFKRVGADKRGRAYVAMEYVHNDLKRLMAERNYTPFTSSEIKHMMKQLLEGVAFLHDNGVMHRDLKPSNILITDKGDLKICDFGVSARFGTKTTLYDPHVGTLWYRAPELLLGRHMYSCAIDMWAVGCIMVELVLNQVFFQGMSEADQLACIQRTVGKSWNCLRFKLSREASSSSVTRLLTPSCIDLLERLLTYDSEKRITAKEALDHMWFREYCGPTNWFGLGIRGLYVWCNKRLKSTLS